MLKVLKVLKVLNVWRKDNLSGWHIQHFFVFLRLRIHLWLKKCLDKDYFSVEDASLIEEMPG